MRSSSSVSSETFTLIWLNLLFLPVWHLLENPDRNPDRNREAFTVGGRSLSWMEITNLQFINKSVQGCGLIDWLTDCFVHYFKLIVLEFHCLFYWPVIQHHAILLQQFPVGCTRSQYPEIVLSSENFVISLLSLFPVIYLYVEEYRSQHWT